MTPTPKKNFEINELVFAKVKGYPHWPARITDVRTPGKFYSVQFYGTNETGNIRSSELWSFHGFKDKYITEKSKKNPQFLKGVIEVLQVSGDPVPAEDLIKAAETPKPKTPAGKLH